MQNKVKICRETTIFLKIAIIFNKIKEWYKKCTEIKGHNETSGEYSVFTKARCRNTPKWKLSHPIANRNVNTLSSFWTYQQIQKRNFKKGVNER